MLMYVRFRKNIMVMYVYSIILITQMKKKVKCTISS